MLFPTNHMAALGTHSPLPNINAQQSWQERKITTCFYFVVKTHTGGKELKALALKTQAQHDTPTRKRGSKIVGVPIF